MIDRDELYEALSQWDWQDLYLPVHFKEMVDELPAVDGGYTEQDVRDSYNDGFSMGVQRGYEDAVLHYAKLALKQWIPVSERLPDREGRYLVTLPLVNGYPWLRILHYGMPDFDEEYRRRCWYETGDYCDIAVDGIVAWMPLSEPWKGDSDETD